MRFLLDDFHLSQKTPQQQKSIDQIILMVDADNRRKQKDKT